MTFSLLGNGLAPVIDETNILEHFPQYCKPGDSAPVRDAIVAALLAMFQSYQDAAEYAKKQSDILDATGVYLRGLCEDRGVYPQSEDDSDDVLRQRALATPDLVTPVAIVAAVNSILAEYTTSVAKYFEASLDRWFCFEHLSWPSTPVDACSFVGLTPLYQDRLYQENTVIPALASNPYSADLDPGGMWLFSDCIGRYFVIRCPAIPDTSDEHMFISTGDGTGSFVSNGFDPDSYIGETVTIFGWTIRQNITEIYSSIVTAVDRIKGAGMRWMLFVDPTL